MADAAIPLSYRPPQVESGADMLQRSMTLQNLANTSKLNDIRLREEQMKEKQAAEDREDMQKVQTEFLNPKHLVPDKDDPTHRVMNWDSLRGSLAGKVGLRTLKQLDADHLQEVKAAQDAASAARTEKSSRMNELVANNKLIGQEIQGLQNLSDQDKPAFYAGSLQRLKKAGVDISGLPPTIPSDGSMNDWLTAHAAAAGYSGALLNDALRKQKAEQAAATAKRQEAVEKTLEQKEIDTAKQQDREAISRLYLAANPQNAGEHQALMEKIAASYPSVADEYSAVRYDPEKTAKTIQSMALSAQQRSQEAGREETAEDRRQRTADWIDLRREIAENNNALRRELAPGGAAKRTLTGNALKVEERNIAALENGTASRPGLNTQRRKIGTMLETNVDEKGVKFDPTSEEGQAIRARLQSALEGVNDNLQQTQFRKAKLYGIEIPANEDIDSAKDGAIIEADDGSRWKKSYGVAFFVGGPKETPEEKPEGVIPGTEQLGGTRPGPAGAPIPKGLQKKTAPPPAKSAPAEASAPKKQTKAISMAQVKEFAKRYKVSDEVALKHAKDEGYEVK